MSDTTERASHLRELHNKQGNLFAQLVRALDLEAFYPEAFEHGLCTSKVTGNPARGYTFTVTRGDEGQKSWPVCEVPGEVLEAWLAHQAGHTDLRKHLRKCGAAV